MVSIDDLACHLCIGCSLSLINKGTKLCVITDILLVPLIFRLVVPITDTLLICIQQQQKLHAESVSHIISSARHHLCVSVLFLFYYCVGRPAMVTMPSFVL